MDKAEFIEECKGIMSEMACCAEDYGSDAEAMKLHDTKLSALLSNLARDSAYIATYLADKLEESGANVKAE